MRRSAPCADPPKCTHNPRTPERVGTLRPPSTKPDLELNEIISQGMARSAQCDNAVAELGRARRGFAPERRWHG